jgi:hypothetical protein
VSGDGDDDDDPTYVTTYCIEIYRSLRARVCANYFVSFIAIRSVMSMVGVLSRIAENTTTIVPKF